MTEVEQFFDGLAARFKPERAEGMRAVYQFDVTGAQGGQWHADIPGDGTCTVAKGVADAPTVTLRATDENLLKLVSGRLNPQMAFMTGKLKVKGDIGQANKLSSLFL